MSIAEGVLYIALAAAILRFAWMAARIYRGFFGGETR